MSFAKGGERVYVMRKEGKNHMDERMDQAEKTVAEDKSALRAGMAFLSENLDAYGFVSDAYPVVTDRWLIAANGHEAETGTATFTYPNVGGAEGLYRNAFNGMTLTDATTSDVLTRTFGAETERREHPVARYVAALSECVALRVLSEADESLPRKALATRMGFEVSGALNALREFICYDKLTARDAKLYTVSMAVCRMTQRDTNTYILDWLVCGDYRAFLLDSDGLRPLHLPNAEGLSPENSEPPDGKRIVLHHPAPFALLLLSGSACDITAAEEQSRQENPGLIWLYRMRLEANILRILTSCGCESDFEERARRFFTGRANGRESASGAMALFCKGASFGDFRSDCLTRLRHMEDMIALLPDGYDSSHAHHMPSRTETETAYIRRLLTREPGLSERTSDALCALALQRLHGEGARAHVLPPDVPDYRRLLSKDITDTFRVYDRENDEDYTLIRQNAVALREYVAENWMTLRPILLSVLDDRGLRDTADLFVPDEDDGESEWTAEDEDEVAIETSARPVERRQCDRTYRAVLRINARLSELLERRNACMEQVTHTLAEQALILRENGADWLHGRAGEGHACQWADDAAEALSDALRRYANTYEKTEAHYRSLLAAYLSERDLLFARDAEWASGVFAEEWQAILEGRLSETDWNAYRSAIIDMTADDGDGYAMLWDDIHIISRGTGARYAQIRSRAADTRMARDLAAREELRIAAVRASAYQDADWGDAVCALLDPAHRTSYNTMVRRWQETCELMARQAAAYEEYRALYDEYRSPEE